jgi:hypothetical protein
MDKLMNRAFSKEEVQMAKTPIKEIMQVKTMLGLQLTPVRMAIIKNTNNNKMLTRVGG